jgi:PAS domain-containing protein
LSTTTHAQVGVFTTDGDLIIQVWDATLARFTGISEESASRQSLTALLPDLEQRGLLKHFQRSLNDGVVEVLAPAFHHYLIPCAPVNRAKHFEKMQQRVTIAPLRDDDSIAGLIVTVEDVTDRLESERELAARLSAMTRRLTQRHCSHR